MPNQVFDDARFVMRYATARGLLTDNSLPNAIAQAEQRLDAHGNLPADAEAELSKALNAAAKLILPMTIDRLRAQQGAENLTGWKRRVYVSWAYVINLFTPIVVYALCVAFIVLIIPWTTQFNRLASFATELKETEKQDIVSLMEEDRIAFLKLQSPTRTTPPPRKSAPQTGAGKPDDDSEIKHQQRLKTLRDLDSKIAINLHSITDTIDIETGEPYLWKMIAHTYGLGYEKKEPPAPPVKGSAPIVETQPPADTKQPRPPRSNAAAPAQQLDSVRPRNPDECDSARTPLVCKTFSYGDANGFWVNSPSRLQAALKARRQAESVGALLGSSILPVLYGLLGATVFLPSRLSGRKRSWRHRPSAARGERLPAPRPRRNSRTCNRLVLGAKGRHGKLISNDAVCPRISRGLQH